MSRTKRTHWLREEMRDGVKRPHVKTKKDKTPPLLDAEVGLVNMLIRTGRASASYAERENKVPYLSAT